MCQMTELSFGNRKINVAGIKADHIMNNLLSRMED